MNVLDILDDVLPIIKKAAPLLADALGTPTAGWIVALLCNAFGSHPTDLNTLAANIFNDPNSEEKLHGIQNDYLTNIKRYLPDNLKMPKSAEITIKLQWDTQLAT